MSHFFSSWCAGMNSLTFMYRAPSSSSTAEDMTVLIICAIVRMDQLFCGYGESLDINNPPPPDWLM